MKRPCPISASLICALLVSLSACKPTPAPETAIPAVTAPSVAEPPLPVAPQTVPVEPELAKEINDAIDATGAKAVVAALDRDGARFRKASDAIASADPVWLTIALRLREGSDAGTGETLSHALARALPNAPERVLALVGHGYTVGNLCTSPFIEPAPGVAEAYEAKAAAALQSVTDPALKTTVDECIKGVTLPPK
jgi:hypothetical protein